MGVNRRKIMYDVCALGELLVDFTPAGVNGEGTALFGRNPGGAPANVLAMNARLGGKTVFIGKVGGDEFGSFLEAALKDAGVDTRGLVRDPAYLTTLAFVHLSETGDRSFSFYRRESADLMLSWGEVDRRIIDDAALFHCGSVSLCGEPCRTATREAARYARSKGKVVSYDPNYRPFLWPDSGEAKAEIGRLIPDADLLKVSEEEMIFLTGEDNVERGGVLLAERHGAVALVSRGAKGARFHCADGSGSLPAYDVRTIDTTGAGDAFLGAVHYRIRGKTRSELQTISRDELADIVDFANAAGSLATTRKGAIPALPSREEIEACRLRSRLTRP
jgi:fructokinase